MATEVDLSGVRALLVDMDGTLVDSDAAVERAWRTWAGEHGVDADEVLAIAHGAPAEDTVRRVLPDLPEEEVAASATRQLELQYDDLDDVVPTPGAAALLAVLERHELPWAVVTSADVRLAGARLGAVGLQPPLVVTVEDVRAGKPDPEPYRLAASRLGVDVRSCLVVEDSLPGVRAGAAAGATVAALKGVPADLAVVDLAELADLLAVALA